MLIDLAVEKLAAPLVGLCTALKLVGGFGKIVERVFRTRY